MAQYFLCNVTALLRFNTHETKQGYGGYRRLKKKSLTQPSIWLIDRLANLWPFYPVVSDQRDQRGEVGEGGEGDKENRNTSGRSG